MVCAFVRAASVALVVFLILAPILSAQEGSRSTPPPSPTGAEDVGPLEVTYFLTESGARDPLATLRPSEAFDLFTTFTTNDPGSYRISVTSGSTSRNLTWSANLSVEPTIRLPLIAPASDTPNFTVVADVLVERANGTNVTRLASDTISLTVPVVTPAPTGDPTTTPRPPTPVWVWALAAVVLLAVVPFAVQKARKRQVKVAPRSRTLSELQVEDKAEKASPKRAAEVEAARQEVAAREAERLAQRESSILDAKRNDILRSIELMKQRHERGELTAFQFQKLKEKKEAQLAELERQGGA